MKVGTIVKLKVDCLGNKAGTLGVVFYDYGDGFQAIFENGLYDGFSTVREMSPLEGHPPKTEADYFLEEVGFEASLVTYSFKNVMQVVVDYRKGLFDIAWSEGWKVKSEQSEILRKHTFGTEKLADFLNQRMEVCAKLRELSDLTPKEMTVLLPDCKPAEFYRADVEVPFVNVELSKLLHFIADMM